MQFAYDSSTDSRTKFDGVLRFFLPGQLILVLEQRFVRNEYFSPITDKINTKVIRISVTLNAKPASKPFASFNDVIGQTLSLLL